MNLQTFSYRKSSALSITFITLIVASLTAALFIAYDFTHRYIYAEFERLKFDVLDQTIKPYNHFFHNKLPEISFYQGYMDSTAVSNYSDSVFQTYPFISRIVFYDTEIGSKPSPYAFITNRLYMSPARIYQFGKNVPPDSVLIFEGMASQQKPSSFIDEFNKIAGKFSAYLQSPQSTDQPRDDHLLGVFYNISPNSITFMNIPREEELKAFKQLMYSTAESTTAYQQDILSFKLNPHKLEIVNTHKSYYQDISIQPITFEEVDEGIVSTELPFSGAFSEYKLQFRSSSRYLSEQIIKHFLPLALAIILVYGILFFIGFLIFRNLNINNKMFKLQYDFVNNLTHEFKTPVSVIKIAGNNIRNASQLSDRERAHYGRILDEEADKLNNLLNKLLSFTQIENQTIHIKQDHVNLDVFIQNLIDAYEVKYPDFDISFELRDVEYFTTDAVLLSSLFQNLMDNAYKYSLPGRKKLHICICLDKTRLLFKFTDQGIGIQKDELTNIFKKFYRIQNEFNQQGSVGLGLAFCKELVVYMKGEISVKSKVGTGSEFIINLPYS